MGESKEQKKNKKKFKPEKQIIFYNHLTQEQGMIYYINHQIENKYLTIHIVNLAIDFLAKSVSTAPRNIN